MDESDSILLARYAQERCDASFTELVNRRVGLVFSAAMRQVGGNRQLAEDITQSVFSDLARKASTLAARENLSGWLYTSTRFAATKQMEAERRRTRREEKLMLMQESLPEATEDWEKMQPVLDEAIHELPERDREAVLIRFFEGCGFAEVGRKIGISEDAARMRVDRALEKLRKVLVKKGVVSTTAAITAALVHPSLTAAPAGLAATVAASAMGGAVATGAGLTFLKIMGMTKVKTAVVAVVLAGMSVPMVLQHQSNLELRARNAQLAKQTESLAEEIAPLKQENARLAAIAAENGHRAEQAKEVFKLRDEVTRLRADVRAKGAARSDIPGDSLNEMLRSMGERAARLREGINRMPDKTIPELQFLREKDWFDAVSQVDKLETDAEYRQALRALRDRGKSLAGEKFREGLQKYAEANNGNLPAALSELQPYFDSAVDPAVLARYQLNRSGKLADVPRNDHQLITESAPPADDEYDTRFGFGVRGTTSSTYSRIQEAIESAATAFAEANQGRLPRQPEELARFLREPINSGRVQQFLRSLPPGVTTLAQYKEGR